MQIDLGTMTEPDSGWQQLLDDIEREGKKVALDLSAGSVNAYKAAPGWNEYAHLISAI